MTTQNGYGIPIPSVQGLLPGATSPGHSAILQSQLNTQSHVNLLKGTGTTSGGKYKTKKRKYKNKSKGGSIIVPVLPTTYSSGMGPGQTPEAITAQLASTHASSTANRQYDNLVSAPQKIGGSKNRKKRKTKRYKHNRNRKHRTFNKRK